MAVAGAVQGDLGRSIAGNRKVLNVIAERLSLSLFLAALSTIVVLVAGIGLGTWAALKRGAGSTD